MSDERAKQSSRDRAQRSNANRLTRGTADGADRVRLRLRGCGPDRRPHRRRDSVREYRALEMKAITLGRGLIAAGCRTRREHQVGGRRLDDLKNKELPMSPLRKTAFAAGALYLLSFVSIPTLFLYNPLRASNYILGHGSNTGIIVGAILEMIVALAGIGTAVALFPVVKRQNEGVALGFVGSRTLEGGGLLAGAACVLSLVTLQQAGAGTNALVTGHT